MILIAVTRVSGAGCATTAVVVARMVGSGKTWKGRGGGFLRFGLWRSWERPAVRRLTPT